MSGCAVSGQRRQLPRRGRNGTAETETDQAGDEAGDGMRDGAWVRTSGQRVRAWGQNAQKGTENAPQGGARVRSAGWFSFF
jgi:hypothetical protein